MLPEAHPTALWTLFVQDVAPANAGGNITGFTLTFDNQQGVNANFTYNVAGNGMQFNSANQLNAIYNWSFGDGNTSSLATPINNYTQSGTYTVVLVATDSCGTDSTTQMVNVFVYPEPTCTRNFDLTTAPVPMPDNIAPGAIIGATLSGIDGVNLGADVNLTGVCIKGKHTNVGDIRLVLVAPNGATVNLMNQPGAPASPKGCSGDDFDVCFIRSTGLSLEDTCRTTLPAIEGTFTASNGFDLQSINTAGGNPNGLWRLFAADLAPLDTGEITSVTLTFDSQILTNATFTYSLNNNEVQCTSIPSPNATYQWTFGDGSTSTDANPFYTYNTNGFFNISLTVTDTCGTLTTTQPISVFYYTEPTCVVSVPFTGLPVAIPNFDTTGVTVNLNVNGIDGVNLGTDVNLVGVCLNGAHPKVGDLRVLLVSPSGVSVELMNRPGFPGVACSGDDFDFCVIRGINNSNENSCEPIAPSIAGTFTALEGFNLDTINMVGGNPNGQWQLIVYDLANGNLGNLISASLIFDNQNTVNASFTVSQNGSTVQCNSANAINTSYNWTFSDGFTSTDANPTHNFALTGTYSINLIATDSCGSDSSTQQVNIVTYAPVTCAKSFDFTTIATAIPDNDITGLTLPLNITNVAGVLGTDVSLVSVCVSGTHTNVGDLKMELIAPNGKVVQLIDQPGFPLNATGCNGDDFNFCIERGIGADAENTCNVTVPAITGPFTAMSGFNLDSINIAGGNANGLWQLVIYDLLNGETGDVVTAQLVFDNQPQANATFGSTMNGYSVTLNAANVANTLYNWTLGDGNIATGATINHSYISNGAYVVTLTATDSCGSVSSVQGLIINEPITCERTYDYAVVPQNIPDNDTAGITLSYNLNGVAGNNLGLDVRLTGVCISGTHSRVGDVALSLTAPNLKTVTLMDRPGYPATASGCTTPDFDFCIIGGSGIDNEQACNATAPAISGSFIAINDNLDSINYFGGNPNGNWQLNATDLNAGETGSINAFKLLFNGQPPIADFTFVINGYDVTFTGPVLSNATYSWNFGDLGTSNLQNPTHTYANNGSYQVVLTVTDSCGTTLSVITLPITVGVNEIQTSNISIVPNPAHSFVDLLVFNSGLETMHVSITNSLGQIVFTHQIDDKTNTYTKRINCADWSKGIYYVKLFSPTGVKQQKLIIQ
jgi:PKD repeat protein